MVRDFPHPGDEGCRFIQIADGIDDLQKYLLGIVTGNVFISYGLLGEIKNIRIKRGEQCFQCFAVACFGFRHKTCKF